MRGNIQDRIIWKEFTGSRGGRPGYVAAPGGGRWGGAEWEAKGKGEQGGGGDSERGIAPALLNDF